MASNSPDAGPDAPVVSFERPLADTTVVRGSPVVIAVSVTARNNLASVRADVTGALNFQFPAASPGDSAFQSVYRVETAGAAGNELLVTITATDIMGNRGIARRSVQLH